MTQRYKKSIMWGLFAVLFLAVMLVQTISFGHTRVWGVKVSLVPIALCCICLQVGHEAGGIFGLAAGLLWSWTGADDGSVAIITFTLIGVFAGWLCDNVFPRRFLPAMILSLAAVFCHELVVFVLKYYLESTPGSMLVWVPAAAGLSLPAAPVLYLLAKAIGKAGGN